MIDMKRVSKTMSSYVSTTVKEWYRLEISPRNLKNNKVSRTNIKKHCNHYT